MHDTKQPPFGVVVEGLTKRFGLVQAVVDVSLRVGPGVHGLLGPNGAGKTTLLRMLATAEHPTSGSIEILGRSPTNGLRDIRRIIGYAPQEGGLYPHFTVRRYLEYIALLREVADRTDREQAVESALALADLVERADVKIRKLSGGMRRRLLVSQASLADPAVLLLDEPFAGLDPEQRVRMRTMVSQLGRRTVVIVSTHQTEDVMHLCDEVLVLAKGRIRFQGTPDELIGRATSRVWIGPASDVSTMASSIAGGQSRHLGDLPPGRDPVRPTMEDAYLLLLRKAEARDSAL